MCGSDILTIINISREKFLFRPENIQDCDKLKCSQCGIGNTKTNCDFRIKMLNENKE